MRRLVSDSGLVLQRAIGWRLILVYTTKFIVHQLLLFKVSTTNQYDKKIYPWLRIFSKGATPNRFFQKCYENDFSNNT